MMILLSMIKISNNELSCTFDMPGLWHVSLQCCPKENQLWTLPRNIAMRRALTCCRCLQGHRLWPYSTQAHQLLRKPMAVPQATLPELPTWGSCLLGETDDFWFAFPLFCVLFWRTLDFRWSILYVSLKCCFKVIWKSTVGWNNSGICPWGSCFETTLHLLKVQYIVAVFVEMGLDWGNSAFEKSDVRYTTFGQSMSTYIVRWWFILLLWRWEPIVL